MANLDMPVHVGQSVHNAKGVCRLRAERRWGKKLGEKGDRLLYYPLFSLPNPVITFFVSGGVMS